MKSTQTYPKPQFKRFSNSFHYVEQSDQTRNRTKIYESTNHNHKDITDIVQRTLDSICKALTQGNNVELKTLAFSKSKLERSCRKKPQSTRNRCSYTPSCRVKFKAGRGDEGLENSIWIRFNRINFLKDRVHA